MTVRQSKSSQLHLIHSHWPLYPNGVALFWVISTCVIQKKDDFNRERLPCSTHSFHTPLRLRNLITREGILSPGIIHTLSRSDRIFLSLRLAEARVIHCYSLVFENLGIRTIPSDHPAVRLVIQKPTTRGHISKRPVFCYLLQRLHDDHRCSADLADFELFLKRQKRQTVRELSRKTLVSLGVKLLIASTALRAHRNRHLGALVRCWEARELVGKCFDPISVECIEFHELSQKGISCSRARVSVSSSVGIWTSMRPRLLVTEWVRRWNF